MKKEILKLCGNVDKSVESQAIFQHKKSFFKKLGVSILACFMFCMPLFTGCSSLCQGGSAASPAPTGPLGDIAPNPVSPLGLDPENDPVIYTTESGLEIKYGGLDLEGTLASGNLKGYPYFTMGTYSGKAVNWVIIGRAPDVTQNVYIGEKQSLLFSTWKANSNNVLAKYFASNTFETNSPAGSAINASTASKSYVVDNEKITTSLSSITSSSGITSGCVFVLSEGTLGSSKFGSNNIYQGSTLQTYCTNLYNSGLALTSSQKALIVPQTLNISSKSGAYKTSTNQYIFAPAEAGYSYSDGKKEEFALAQYLTASQRKLSVSYWVSSASFADNYTSQICDTTGDFPNYSCSNTYAVRPACVVKLS